MDECDISHLEEALALAERGKGRTSPNPIVGARIVKDQEVLGEGWHTGPGLDHAEVAAIKDALVRAGLRRDGEEGALNFEAARRVCGGATVYVTLEPCCTQGRTPPCTRALVVAGFGRAVVGASDPSPAVDGKGIAALRKAGISVEMAGGDLRRRAMRQNNGMRKTVTRGTPFVHYKFAMSLDGRLHADSGDSRWISGPESRRLVHQWRAWSDAVVVGAKTAMLDDPLLTARGVECVKQPLRVVVDAEVRLGEASELAASVGEGPILVICGEKSDEVARSRLEGRGVETVGVSLGADGEPDPVAVGSELARRGVQSVLLEGGATLAGSWWAGEMVDKVSAFVCPKIISGTEVGGSLVGRGVELVHEASTLCETDVRRIGSDVLITGFREGPF